MSWPGPSARDADRAASAVCRRLDAREAREPLETVCGELLVPAVEHLEIDVSRAFLLQFPHELGRMPVRHDVVVSPVVDGNGEALQCGEVFRGGTERVFVRRVRRASAEARIHVVHIMLLRRGEVRVPGCQVGNRTPDVHGAEQVRRVLRGQQRGMSAARAAQQEDVPAVDRCDPGGVFHRVEDIAPRLEAAAGVMLLRVRCEVRAAEFRQKQRPAVLLAQREIGLELVGPVIAPGVESDDERDGYVRLRMVKKRRLERAVQRRFDLKRVRLPALGE